MEEWNWEIGIMDAERLYPFFHHSKTHSSNIPAFHYSNCARSALSSVKEDGNFVFTYTLQQSGRNDLVFVAEDAAGNKTTVTKTLDWK